MKCSLQRYGMLVLISMLAGCGGEEASPGAEQREERIVQASDLTVARDTTLAQAVIVTGTLEPYRRTEVRAQVPGTVAALRADRGDAVNAGSVLAVLNAAGIRSAAEAAKASVAAAQAGEALARRQLESALRLYERGALSAIELQGTQTGYDAAAGQLAAARAQLAGAAEAAGYANVVAPFQGIVSARDVNPGEAVSPGQLLFTVVDPRILELAGEVPIEVGTRLRPGARVEFTIESYPDEVFTGQVVRIEPVADATTRRVGMYLRLQNDGRLVGGMFATGRVHLGASARGVAVPVSALRTAGAGTFVWLVKGGTTRRQPVEVLLRDDGASLAQLRGVSAGDTVIVTPGDLKEGVKLRIEPRRAGGAEAGA